MKSESVLIQYYFIRSQVDSFFILPPENWFNRYYFTEFVIAYEKNYMYSSVKDILYFFLRMPPWGQKRMKEEKDNSEANAIPAVEDGGVHLFYRIYGEAHASGL
ncbi:MAG: hypothetical protein JXI43_10625 [Tissierellales bacterium]|nr:hypothetical protein [Tissierellales bacterium]